MPSLNLPSLNFNIDGSANRDTLNNILDTLQLYRKELNFLLMNLDGDNMPSVIGRIEDGEGNISLINQTIDGIQMAVSSNSGDIANLQVMADEISASVADNTGNISQLNIKANNISAAVADNAGNISQLQITASGLQSTAVNHAGQISILTQTAQGLQTQVTNNKNAISTVTQTVNGLQSTVTSIDDTVGIHSSQIRQLDSQISSKVSYTDYNGREIISLIEQTPYYIKLSADKIDLDGITQVAETLYVGGSRYDGTIILGSSFTEGSIHFNGESIRINAMSGIYARSAIQDGLIITDDILYDEMFYSGAIVAYYRTNRCYIDYGGGSRLTVRDRRGDVVGHVDIY